MPQLELAGERVNLIEAGVGPPLLLVHGYPSNALSWRLVMDQLLDRHRMLAPDQVGFGRSTRRPTRPLHGDAYADRLVDLLDALGLDRVDVAGLSWGGAVAQRLALRRPARIRRLVLVASVSASRPLRLSAGDLFGITVGRMLPGLARMAVRRYLRRATAGRLRTVDVEAIAHGYVDPLGEPGTLGFYRRFIRSTRETSVADVSAITAPTLVITADADRIVPPDVGLELAAAIPGARQVVLPGLGHAVQFEAPERIAGLIAGFLAD